MSFIGDFIGNTLGGITGAKQAGQAAERAAGTQVAFSQQGIEEQRRQFDALIELMSPYVAPGAKSIQEQQALLGLLGTGEQQRAISGIEQGPTFGALARQGEEAILQRASATGGLRGGNVQAALAQFRPQLLQQLIDKQYANLGGLTDIGVRAAGGQAGAGSAMGVNVANLLGQQGQAAAGGQIAEGSVAGRTFGGLASIGGALAGSGIFGGAPSGIGIKSSGMGVF